MVKLKAGDLLVESKLEMKSEDVKWCIYFGKLCEGSSNGETKLPYYAAILFLLMQSIEMKTCLHKKFNTNDYSSINYNSQKMETAKLTFNQWLDK